MVKALFRKQMLEVFDRDDLTEFQYVVNGDDWNVILK